MNEKPQLASPSISEIDTESVYSRKKSVIYYNRKMHSIYTFISRVLTQVRFINSGHVRSVPPPCCAELCRLAPSFLFHPPELV